MSAALALWLWILIRLPISIQIAADFFRRLSVVIQSPLFVFLFFNGIIFALVIIKSSRFATPSSCDCGNSLLESTMVSLEEEDGVVVFQEQQIITSSQQVNSIPDSSSQVEEEDDGSRNDAVFYASESGSEEGDDDDDDELSNEEFQRTVEEFIAKNLRFFRREETVTFNDN